jgi:hypothetical protein
MYFIAGNKWIKNLKCAHSIFRVYIKFFFSSLFLTVEGAHTVKAEASGMVEMDSAINSA